MDDLAKLFGGVAKANVDLSSKDIKVYEGIRYLMPAREALEALKLPIKLPSKVMIACPGLPRDSLFYYAVDGRFEGQYNRLYLVVDRADQVVSVQLVNETPRDEKTSSSKDNGWYTYNFVNTRSKAMNTLRIDHKVNISTDGTFAEFYSSTVAPAISSKNENWTLARVDSVLLQLDRTNRDRVNGLEVKERVRWYVARPIVELILSCVQQPAK